MPAEISSVIASLDRNVELDQILARHIEEEAGGRVGRARHEADDVLGLPAAVLTKSALGGCDRNTSDHMPCAGNSTSATLRNLEPVFENKVSKICFIVL